MYRPALILGSLFALLAVILGAFGAHTLKEIVSPTQLAIFEKGVTYQFYHSLGLLASGILFQSFSKSLIKLATVFFALGILLFSGSLYLMVGLAASGGSIGAAGIITPIGGLCFIGAWALLFSAFLSKK